MRTVWQPCAGLVAAVLLVFGFGAAQAQTDDGKPYIEQAQRALAALDYEAARHALEKALFSGHNDPDTVARLYRLLATIHASLGQPVRAEQHFRRLLALKPRARLPRGVSPKIAAPFARARRYMKTRGRVVAECTPDAVARSISLRVDTDPVGIVAGARVTYRLPEGEREQVVEIRSHNELITLAMPTRDRIVFICAALDKHGNQLVEIGSWAAPLVLEAQPAAALRAPPPAVAEPESAVVAQPAPPAGPTASPQAWSWYRRWYPWGVGTALATGAGAYFGIAARIDEDRLATLNRDSAEHSFSEAQALERSSRRNALLANVGFGVAGAMAITTLTIWALDFAAAPDEATPDTPVARLVPLPLPAGAAVSLDVSF